jgi:hypothetical protein
LRLLELEILRASRTNMQSELNIHSLININVDQFFGIEIEEFPAQIAQVALWLMDHQMNLLVSEEFGLYFVRIPLEVSSTIVRGNALTIDWEEVVPARHVSYIMGNPPYGGKKEQSPEQKAAFMDVMADLPGSGVLDFVAAWYVKAVLYAHTHINNKIKIAFVSTSSISQGEQVGVLWSWMLAKGIKIFFAHRTFQWNNEARGKAAVHCVIIGFSLNDVQPKWLFEYENIKGEPQKIKAQNINPYLVDAPNIILGKHSKTICRVSPMMEGSALIDNGHFLFDEDQAARLLAAYPVAKNWLRKLYSGDDFINGNFRWCLWLENADPADLRNCKPITDLIERVQYFRLHSSREATKLLAKTPARFGELRQPKYRYLFIPKTSSERRHFVPIGFMSDESLINNTSLFVDNATLYEFGVLLSTMHNAWLRTVCGRLKSDYRYSASIVYNNFPWPENPTEKQKQTIETAAQGVLDARAQFPESTLADLYDPLTMPKELLKAHQTLDRAVDAAYGKTNFTTEAQRVAFLFELYQKYTSLFALEKPKRRKKAETEKVFE